MLKSLSLENVGPAPTMELGFAKRLNVITGDNGLGKSFLLDIAWWAMTRQWPAELNPKLTSGKKALPRDAGSARISFEFTGKSRAKAYTSEFQPREGKWKGSAGRPANPGLVFYAMADGSFALWDPARNYWLTKGDEDFQDRPPAYVFSPMEVWDGLENKDGTWLCNGLIRDWASWQKERGEPFDQLCDVLKVLSASPDEPLTPGELTRISLDDARDMPTVRMPYGQDVPVVHASAGMRRIIALAYFMVWSWQEHQKAARLLGEQETHQAVFLIDEVESHLHPQWQRKVVPALIKVMGALVRNASVQLITATHSPLVMASIEPFFNEKRDAWFDLDFVQDEVMLTRRDFRKHGDVSTWLMSEAFDLKSARAETQEHLIEKASRLLEQEEPDQAAIKRMHGKLVEALSPTDDFLFQWRYIGKRKGWL
ncbi:MULTISPECIES: AAA family ATPase [Halomonadaceae]|uniref:AAA family ATPase n=1 Tax=Halomonadaceae TaxID=28256 RepID=UPI0015830B35|nr:MULTISPECIES: ATP-binding protein [Halomonas]MDI4636707.1 ATP-binding protein [Halomonas sp. BMC7]NUJ61072.1 AAA family ATPase [Halomonas taeanensis]